MRQKLLFILISLLTATMAWATPGNYSTWLKSKVPDNKIVSVANILRSYTGISLKDAKDLAATAPCYVLENVTLEEAKALAKALNDAEFKAKVIDLTTDEEYIEIIGAYSGPTLPATEAEQNYSGAYYTGDYTSPFKTYLGKTDEEIQKKLDDLWNHYFKGNDNSKVYYDVGNEAYIKDINNNDIRSEGMSYGMMICVQTNHKEAFDKLWKFAKTHMWHTSGQWDGYFAWRCGLDGSQKDQNCAPDGEIYFMMSLMFAAHRWNDASYMEDAQYILKKCWKGNNGSLFNESQKIITFQPYTCWDFSDPSYDLPAFVDLFARWSTTNNDKWSQAVKATRTHLYKSSNTTSGLFSDYNYFDGMPKSVSYNSNANKYMYDAMRCAMNFGMDYYLFGADAARQTEMAKRIIDFFEADGYTHARFDWDGKNPQERYTLGETGCNAVACYALMGLPEYEEAIKKNLTMAWEAKPMTGQYRYYDGLVHYLSMLHLCGAFKIWKGQLAPPTAKTELVYTGAKQDLVVGGRGVEANLIKYLVDGTSCGPDIPQGTDAKDYIVKWYASSTKYPSMNTPDFSLTVTILPKTVSAPTITLSQTSYFYDGTAKKPTVTVKDGETVIPASEYTVGYENNTKVGKATVTITDKDGGNYIVSGSTTFEILLKGDANGDKKVNVADIVEMVNAKNGKASAKFVLKNADIDGSGKITQADINAVVKIIMQK